MSHNHLPRFALVALTVLALLAFGPAAVRAETTLYSSSFEGVDWSDFFSLYAQDSGQTITQTSQLARTGSQCALMAYSAPGTPVDEYLVFPAIDLSNHDEATLSFWEYQQWWTGYGVEHQVCVSVTVPDDPAAFQSVLSMTPQDHTIPELDWQQVTIDLSAYGGQPTVYVALRYRGEDADNWYVDDALLTAKYRHDVGITAYAPPPWPGRQGFGFDHRIVIQNLGTQPLVNASLHWRLDDPQGNLFAEETRDLSGVGPGQEQAYTFYTTPTFTGFTASQAWVETQNDEDPGNDAVFGGAWTYSLGRKSIGLLGFSDNHAPSQEAEYPFDVFPEIADNTLGLIRLPSPVPGGDPSALYYNASQDIDRMRAMTGRTGVPAPPEFDADNVLDDAALFYINLPWKRGLAGWSEVPAAWLALSQNAGAPLALSTAMVWDNGTYGGFLDVTVEVVDDLKPGVDYVLYAAMVEDDASGSGHDQVLRDLFPNIDGQVIDPTPGTAVYPVYVGRAEENVPENLRLVTFVVEHNGDGSYGAIVNGSVRWWLDSSTPVDDAPPAVARTRLVGNAPNPFNPSTVITYDLARPGTVTLEVFDVGGRLVRRLENGTLQSAGRHQVRWDGRDQAGRAAPSGAYFSRLVADGRSETRGMVLVK